MNSYCRGSGSPARQRRELAGRGGHDDRDLAVPSVAPESGDRGDGSGQFLGDTVEQCGTVAGAQIGQYGGAAVGQRHAVGHRRGGDGLGERGRRGHGGTRR